METIKKNARDITEKMERITEHLQLINEIDFQNSRDIYNKEMELLVYLYNYYCQFQKLYIDFAMSTLINQENKDSFKALDINNYIMEIKQCSRIDYKTAIEFLEDKDKLEITAIYEKYNEELDNLATELIKIQSSIILKNISPIEQEAMVQTLKKRINISKAIENYNEIGKNYLIFMDEYKASMDAFE